jgi:hypothetical protein
LSLSVSPLSGPSSFFIASLSTFSFFLIELFWRECLLDILWLRKDLA